MGNPLRPIISQIPTPSYKIAKRLNEILTPYVPSKYCLKSSSEFIEFIKDAPTNGIMASMDVESLFTNVPVDETIDLILDRVYRDESTPKLKIPEHALKSLLQICTKKAPFRTHKNQLYVQEDGIAMGSPLGVLFANFYMGVVEERVFSEHNPPSKYARYIDDTFVITKDLGELQELIRRFKENSRLNFTHELSCNGTLPFLDVRVHGVGTDFKTSVYTKSTNTGMCMSGESECPTRYSKSVIRSYIERALSHSSSWTDVHKEFNRVTQVLVDNGFSNKDIEKQISLSMSRWYNPPQAKPTPEGQIHKVFFRAYFNSQHKEEEKRLRNIIDQDVTVKNPKDKLNLVIYYKNKKTSNLLMNNCPRSPNDPLQQHHVVYQYKCHMADCPASYIGMTTLKLSKRLSVHLQEGAIFNHHRLQHRRTIKREEITSNTTVLSRAPDAQRLKYLEAVSILNENPSLNTTNEIILLPSLLQRIRIERNTSIIPAERETHATPTHIDEERNEATNENSGIAPRSPIITRSRRQNLVC